MSNFPTNFVVNPGLTSIAIAYKNEKLIADSVLPRVPVDTPSFLYSVFNKTDNFTIPDTKVGRKSAVNQIDWSATQASASVEDEALEDPIPNRDISIARSYGNNINPQEVSTEQVTNLIELAREKRSADLVFNTSTYAAANKSTLAGTSQWSDYTNSDPEAAIATAMDSMLMRPNQLVLGREVYSKVRRHPKVIQAFNRTDGQYGAVPDSYLLELFEVDEILVGEGWLNLAKKGQTPNMVRVWGKSAALLYKSPVSQSTHSMSFGITAQWEGRVSGTYQDPKIGARGATVVRVFESVKELVLANDLGYLFSAAVA